MFVLQVHLYENYCRETKGTMVSTDWPTSVVLA